MVTIYTGDRYIEINGRLRDGNMNGVENEVQQLDSAISKFELKNDIEVHRGISSTALSQWFGTDDVDEINSKFKGGTIQDKGFVSTSTSPDKAFFEKVKLRITVKKGKGKGAYIAPISNYKRESEFLLKRNSTFKIKGASKTDNYGGVLIDVEV